MSGQRSVYFVNCTIHAFILAYSPRKLAAPKHLLSLPGRGDF